MRNIVMVTLVALVCLLSGACDDRWGPASGDNLCDLKTLQAAPPEPAILKTLQEKGWLSGCLRIESETSDATLPVLTKAVKVDLEGRIWAHELPVDDQGPLSVKLPDVLRDRSLLFRVIVPGSVGQGRPADIEAFCKVQFADRAFACQQSNPQLCWFEMYFRASLPNGKKSAIIPNQPDSVACWLHAPWKVSTPGEVIVSDVISPDGGVGESVVSDGGVVEPVVSDRGDECRPGARESCIFSGGGARAPVPPPDPNCQGTRTCSTNGVWGACEGVVSTEICGDKIDNNCNGKIDEDCSSSGCLDITEGCVFTIAGTPGKAAEAGQKNRTTTDKALFAYPQGVLAYDSFVYVTEAPHGQIPSTILLRVIAGGYVSPVKPLFAQHLPPEAFGLGVPKMMTRYTNNDFWLVDNSKSQAYQLKLPLVGTTQELLMDKVDLSKAGSPYAIAFDQENKRLLFSSYNGHRVWQFSLAALGQAKLELFAGSETAGYADGVADKAMFRQPTGLAIFKETLYVAELGNHCIRTIDLLSKEVSTFAGKCEEAGAVDQMGTDARFRQPAALDVDKLTGTLFVADGGNHCIRKIVLGGAQTGLVSTLAGSCGASGRSYMDGQLLDARFVQPNGISFDGTGSLYVADSGNHVIRKIMLPR